MVNHKCDAFVVFALNYCMKKIGLILIISLPGLSFSQTVFQGKIVYTISNEKWDSAIVYFSPGKIRSETILTTFRDPADRFTYFLADLEKKEYYLINDSARTVTKLIFDSTFTSKQTRGKRTVLDTKKTIQGFECYGISETKADTFNIVDTDIVVRSKIDTWYTKDIFFPYKMGSFFNYPSILDEKNIFLLIELHLEGYDFYSDKITIAAKTIDQTKLPESLFQVPTTYKMKHEKVSSIFKRKIATETKVKITDLKLEELDTIPSPPPSKPSKSSDKKPGKQKSGNN